MTWPALKEILKILRLHFLINLAALRLEVKSQNKEDEIGTNKWFRCKNDTASQFLTFIFFVCHITTRVPREYLPYFGWSKMVSRLYSMEITLIWFGIAHRYTHSRKYTCVCVWGTSKCLVQHCYLWSLLLEPSLMSFLILIYVVMMLFVHLRKDMVTDVWNKCQSRRQTEGTRSLQGLIV